MPQASETDHEKSRNRAETKPKSAVVTVGNLRFGPSPLDLTDLAGAPVSLRSQSRQVLALLVAHAGQPVSKDRLIAEVWGDTHVTDDSLVQCIADIRRVAGDQGKTLIETLPKLGYRLNPSAGAPPAGRHTRIAALLAACLLLLVALAGWALWHEAPPPDRPRIAVLAFDDFSTAQDAGFLSDAIAEGIITELARYSTLSVLSRSSSFAYRGSGTPVSTIASDLGASYILEGSQQKSGDRLRVTAQLIDARTGDHVWTDTYDRQMADLLTTQEEIVRAVAGIAADVIQTRPLPQSDINRVSAYILFHQSSWNFETREDIEAQLDAGRRALALDPASEWGHLTLGWAHRHMSIFYATPEEREDHLAQAMAYADQAIAIAPQNHIGFYLRARLRTELGDHDGALQAFEQAMALNPSDVRVLVGSSSPYLYTGRFDEGLAVIDRALEIDPKHVGWYHWQRAWALWELNRCDEALAAFNRMAEIPNAAQRMVAATHACLNDHARAEAAMAVFLRENPGHTIAQERAKTANTWPNPPSVERWLEDMAFAGMPNG